MIDAKFVKSAAQRKRDEYKWVYNRLMKLHDEMPKPPCEECERKAARYACTNCTKYNVWRYKAWSMIRQCYLGKTE